MIYKLDNENFHKNFRFSNMATNESIVSIA